MRICVFRVITLLLICSLFFSHLDTLWCEQLVNRYLAPKSYVSQYPVPLTCDTNAIEYYRFFIRKGLVDFIQPDAAGVWKAYTVHLYEENNRKYIFLGRRWYINDQDTEEYIQLQALLKKLKKQHIVIKGFFRILDDEQHINRFIRGKVPYLYKDAVHSFLWIGDSFFYNLTAGNESLPDALYSMDIQKKLFTELKTVWHTTGYALMAPGNGWQETLLYHEKMRRTYPLMIRFLIAFNQSIGALMWPIGATLNQLRPLYLWRLRRWAQMTPHDHVLDLFCGVGMPLVLAARTNNQGSYIGIDSAWGSQRVNTLLARVLLPFSKTISFLKQDAVDLKDFDDARFDKIILGNPHILSIPSLVKEIARVLKPGGSLIFAGDELTLTDRTVSLFREQLSQSGFMVSPFERMFLPAPVGIMFLLMVGCMVCFLPEILASHVLAGLCMTALCLVFIMSRSYKGCLLGLARFYHYRATKPLDMHEYEPKHLLQAA